MLADRVEAAAVDPDDVRAERRVGGRRHEVHCATERGRAEGERVAALVDLDRAQAQRIDLVEVAAAVGEVERNAILQEFDAADMEAAGDAGAADREAHLLAVALLHEHAGHVFQHVAHSVGVAVPERRGIDEGDRADGGVHRRPLRGHARHGERAGGLGRAGGAPGGGRSGDADFRKRRALRRRLRKDGGGQDEAGDEQGRGQGGTRHGPVTERHEETSVV